MAPSKEEAQERMEFKALPPVADLEPKIRKRVLELLELLDQTVATREEAEAAEEAYKLELEELQTAAQKPGFRCGLLCFAAQPTKGRKTLDKMALMENGVPAAIINKSYKEGSPGVRRTFRRLPEE
jgi:hypothetical protein